MNPSTSCRRAHRHCGCTASSTAIWATGPGLQRLAAVNHSVIGMRMMITSFVFFAIAGVLGMLTRVQLATPNSAFMVPETYNQVFTMHGSMMLFLFAIPMVESFAVYLTPKILGTRDFAFPRLTAYGYWCYLFGGTILTVALIAGVAPNSGWFMYTPLSSNVFTPGINSDVWLLGVTFVEISALSLAMEIVVSILKMRAPGMSLDRMPIFAWYILVTAMMMIVAFPPLILGSILLEVERAFGLPFFDPTRGGDRAAVATSVLAVRPPRRLHHLPAHGRRAVDDHSRLRQPAAGRLSGDRRRHHRARLPELRHLGAPHVHRGHSASGARLLLRGLGDRRGADGGADLRLARHAGARQAALGRADALCLRLLLHLRDGRPDRRHARHGAVRLAGP